MSGYGGGGGGGDPAALKIASNLSDVADGATALANLGGIGVQGLSLTTGSIAASGSEQANITSAPANLAIVGAKLTRTAGASTSVTVSLHATDAFGGAIAYIFGSSFFAATIGGDPLYGPASNVGGSDLVFAVPYTDLDATTEIHVQIDNNDGVEAGTFRLDLKVLDVGAY